jgi:HEAT repeat protein
MGAGMVTEQRDVGSSRRGMGDVCRLGATLLHGTNAAQRAAAARHLGAQGFVSAYAYLRHALWDPDETVRASAVDAIGALAVSQSAGELAALYAWSGPRLRRAVLRAARRIGVPSAFDGILALARDDPDARVRVLAARAERVISRGRRRS